MLLLKLVSELQNSVKKNPICSEHISKMQTEFQRSGIFPQSGNDVVELWSFSFKMGELLTKWEGV